MAGQRVLVVEDEPLVNRLLVTILEMDGYTVLGVDDGPAALAAAPGFKPDLALLDADLPGVSGADVARRPGPRQVHTIRGVGYILRD